MAVLLSALGLSGCFRAAQDVKIRADGGGAVELHVEIDKKAMAYVVSRGPRGTIPPMVQRPQLKLVDVTFPDGTTVRTTDDPERSVLDASFEFSGPEDYARRMEQIDDAVSLDDQPPQQTYGSLQVRRVGDRIDVAFSVAGMTEGLGRLDFLNTTAVFPPDLRPRATLTLTMPGPVIETNGNRDGRKVTWDPTETGAGELTASSKIPGGILEDSGKLVSWAIPAGAAALLLVLAVLGTRRRRRRPDGL